MKAPRPSAFLAAGVGIWEYRLARKVDVDYDLSVSPSTNLPDFLAHSPQGSWRIAGTRVSLDSVVYCFLDGATPEEICQDFPALSLAQVYAVIAYYLNNREHVDTYLGREREAIEQVRRDLTARHSDFIRDLRQRLLASRQSANPA